MGTKLMELDKLAPDFVALQAELSPVDKSAANPFFKSKYAPLPEVREALQPLLAKHNFGLSVFPTIIYNEAGVPQNGLHFLLIHTSGQYLDGEWLLTPAKNDSQGQGADTTYKRRFGEMAITGLVADEDDDGNTASRSAAPMQQRSQPDTAALTDADKKRNQLKAMASKNNWPLEAVAAAFTKSVKAAEGKPAELKTASAEDVEAFIRSVEGGLVKVV
jgi:hypothetical protein